MISYDGWDREYEEHKDAYRTLFDQFMSQSNYENIENFEKRFSEMIGRKYVIGVATATDALYFSLLANKIGPGDEVLVSNFSWISSSACISMAGATPVFCDIDIHSYHIDLDSIKKMYSKKTKAIIYTHLFGNMTDTSNILNFCKEKNIVFIEDAAQSIGSSLNGILAGTIGDCSSFSFNTNKVIAGINGGGVFMTDDENQANYVRKIRKHGKDKDFEILGYNSRLYVLNTEIINLRLQHLKKNQITRNTIANQYNKEFKNLPVYTQIPSQTLNHNFHKYTIRFKDKETRTKIKKKLMASVHYEIPLSENNMYKNINHRTDDCKTAKLVSDTILSLPIHAWLTNNEITNIIKIIKSSI